MSGIRFPSPIYGQLTATLLDAHGVESCAIAYAHYVPGADAWIVADASPVPDNAYDRRDRISAVLKAEYLLEVANRSRVTGMAVIFIHTHPDCSTHPTFSATDDDGEAQLAPYLVRRGAPVPHVALVIGANGCRARRLGSNDEIKVWEVGQRLALHSPGTDGAELQREDRQVRAFGEPGQRRLKSLRYGVIGAGARVRWPASSSPTSARWTSPSSTRTTLRSPTSTDWWVRAPAMSARPRSMSRPG
ncbi:hypothetical protein GCM10020258_40670 [Sphingomonas yabuuchiae]